MIDRRTKILLNDDNPDDTRLIREVVSELTRESEWRYADIINFLPDATFAIDLEGKVVAWNLAIEEMTSVKAEDMLGKGNYEYALPFYGTRRPILIDLVFKSDKEIEKKYSFIKKEKGCLIVETDVPFVKGRKLHLWGKASPVYDYKGNVIGAIESIRDITDRKRAEDALQESEEKYRTLVESTLDIIFTVDSKGVYAYINPRFEKVTGYPASDLIGRPFTYILAPEYVESTIGRFKKGIKGKAIPSYYADLIHKNGERIPVEFLVTTLYDTEGKPAGRFGVGRDITERKQVEEELRKAEQEKAIILDNISELIFYLDTDMKVLSVNNAVYKAFNLLPGQLEGKRCYEALHHRNRPCSVCPIEKTLRTGQPQETDVISSYGRNWILRSYPVRDESGCITGAIEVVTDITERKHLEAQLLHAQKMEAIGTLAGGVAHDFNNVLQAISGYIQLLLMRKGENDPDLNYLNQIDISARNATELVQQLLVFSRKVESKLKPVDLNQEIAHVERILERTIPRMVDIELLLADDIGIINADPIQLEQIIMNLAVNARDAMPDGGRLVIETENIVLDEEYCKIHLGAAAGEYVLFTVSDTGCGMDSETLEHIFEPFYTTKEEGGGTGLGLATVYGIVKSHGGYIMCYSEPGHGTTFRIYFPAIKAERIEHRTEREEEKIRGGDETILLVDDEKTILDIGSDILEQYGYTIITAESGEEAIENYEREGERIDLVILDVGMPGMGGHKCLQELLRIDPEIKVIITSGYSANGRVKETLEAGAAGFIGKPYHLVDMLKKVREVLDKNRSIS